MMKRTKTVLARIWWLGRGTATVMGVVVMLALTVGLASTALAGTGIGAPFNLGKTNTVNAKETGKPPMSVNSTTEVQGLNVDSLDSKNSSDFLREPTDRDDFLPRKPYNKEGTSETGSLRQSESTSVTCDPGDTALSGGYFFLLDDHEVFFERVSGDRYTIGWFNTSFETGDSATPPTASRISSPTSRQTA
jgi:hypothetical protein